MIPGVKLEVVPQCHLHLGDEVCLAPDTLHSHLLEGKPCTTGTMGSFSVVCAREYTPGEGDLGDQIPEYWAHQITFL